MTSRDFCYWLQGYLEINGAEKGFRKELTYAQIEMIEKHLAMVFAHEIDPSFGGDNAKLDEIHNVVSMDTFYQKNPQLDPNKKYDPDKPRPRC